MKSEKMKMHDFDATNVLSNDKRIDYDYFDKWTEYKDLSKSSEKAIKAADDELLDDGKPKQKHVNVPADVGRSKVEAKLDTVKHNKEESDSRHLSAKDSVKTDGFGKPKIKYKIKSKHNVTSGNQRAKRITTTRPATNSSTENQAFIARNVTKPNEKVLEPQEENWNLPYYTNVTFRVNASNNDTVERQTTEILKLISKSNADFRPTQPVYPNKMLGESETSATESEGPPYLAFLAGSTTVFAISFIVLLALYFYRRRRHGPSVITDEMYNAYKMNKKMETRSPLPSPRSSEQEGSCEYDFICPENVGKIQTDEIAQASDSICVNDSVYIELEDTPRYDYATAPDPAHSAEAVP